MHDNPLAHLVTSNAAVDRRHDRRELFPDELRRLLSSAASSTTSFRGLTGPDRFYLYAAACGTGFRASALASLTPESFDLVSDLPTVTLAARHATFRLPGEFTKNKKPSCQFLTPWLKHRVNTAETKCRLPLSSVCLHA
jgi:hypothetical protein